MYFETGAHCEMSVGRFYVKSKLNEYVSVIIKIFFNKFALKLEDMATNTRIKDALEPQLYEYYKNHRSKYQRYSQDLPTLRLRLFHDMVEDGSYKSERQKKFDPFVEHKCSLWLSKITGESKNFDDFRKAFRNILKNYKYKSEKYYRVCEQIVNENRFSLMQEDKPSMQQNTEQLKNKSRLFNNTPNRHPINIDGDIVYKKMDNREIPFIKIGDILKTAPSDNAVCEGCVSYMKAKFGEDFGIDDFCEYYSVELSSYKKWSNKWKLVCLKICGENRIPTSSLRNKNANRTPIDIDNDIVIKRMDNRPFPFLRIDGVLRLPLSYWNIKEMCEKWIKRKFGDEYGFDDFCSYYDVELSRYPKASQQWILVCMKICSGTNNPRSFAADKHFISADNKSENIITILEFILLYFGLGGIAYVFKHLIAFFLSLALFIICCLWNVFICLFCVLFNCDIPEFSDFSKTIIDPISIWKFGGLFCGVILIIILASLISDIITKKDDNI